MPPLLQPARRTPPDLAHVAVLTRAQGAPADGGAAGPDPRLEEKAGGLVRQLDECQMLACVLGDEVGKYRAQVAAGGGGGAG